MPRHCPAQYTQQRGAVLPVIPPGPKHLLDAIFVFFYGRRSGSRVYQAVLGGPIACELACVRAQTKWRAREPVLDYMPESLDKARLKKMLFDKPALKQV